MPKQIIVANKSRKQTVKVNFRQVLNAHDQRCGLRPLSDNGSDWSEASPVTTGQRERVANVTSSHEQKPNRHGPYRPTNQSFHRECEVYDLPG